MRPSKVEPVVIEAPRGPVRRAAMRRFLAWGALTAALMTGIYVWAGQGPVTLPIVGVGIPGAMTLVALLEVVTGTPLAEWEARWARLSGMRKLGISVLVVFLAFLTFSAVILPLVVKGIL